MSPIYEWHCEDCGEDWERWYPKYEVEPECPECFSRNQTRKYSVARFNFVGTGFHATDYHKDRPKNFDEFLNGTPHQRAASAPDPETWPEED